MDPSHLVLGQAAAADVFAKEATKSCALEFGFQRRRRDARLRIHAAALGCRAGLEFYNQKNTNSNNNSNNEEKQVLVII